MSYPSGTMVWPSSKSSSFDTLPWGEQARHRIKCSMCADKDSRKEDGAAVSRGPVLEEHPEVVPTDEGLKTGSQGWVPKVLAKLDALVHSAVSVTQVRRERVAKMDVQALLGATNQLGHISQHSARQDGG